MGELDGPFIGTEAIASGTLSRSGLRTGYRAVYRNVYLRNGEQLTPTTNALAAWLFARREATVAGISAAALHGSLWIDAGLPAELNRSSRYSADGIVMHSDALWDDEKCFVSGIPVTTPARTAFDLGRRRGLTIAVVRLDALMRVTELKAADIQMLAGRHHGARGIVTLRRALEQCDPGAESPQETRTRLVLVGAGLPRPDTQVVVRGEGGQFVARIDMGWLQWKVAVEFDGAQHWTDPAQRSRDIDRIAVLEALGWRIIRVSSEMLRYRPGVVVARAQAALRAAGCPF